MSSTFRAFTAILSFVTLLSCGGGDSGGNNESNSSDISIVSVDITTSDGSTTYHVGDSFTATAIAHLSNGNTRDITSTASWSSDGVYITQSGSDSNSFQSISEGEGFIRVRAENTDYSLKIISKPPANITSLDIHTPDGLEVPIGSNGQFEANAIYDDGTHKDVTNTVTFVVTPAPNLSISEAGRYEALQLGTTLVNAELTLENGSTLVSNELSLKIVNAIPIELSAHVAQGNSLEEGVVATAEITALYNNQKTADVNGAVKFKSSDETILTVSRDSSNTIFLHAQSEGRVAVEFYLENGPSVQIEITVTAPTLERIALRFAGEVFVGALYSNELSAIGIYSNGQSHDLTHQASWSTNQPFAIISNLAGKRGEFYTTGTGSFTITASFGGKEAKLDLTSKQQQWAAIRITSQQSTFWTDEYHQFSAEAVLPDGSTFDISHTATWSLSSYNIATISNSERWHGVLHTMHEGTVEVMARINGLEASTTVTIKNAEITSFRIVTEHDWIPIDGTSRVRAIATFDNGLSRYVSAQSTWSGSGAISLNRDGDVLGIREGTGYIDATYRGKRAYKHLPVRGQLHVKFAETEEDIQEAVSVALANYTDSLTIYLEPKTYDFSNSVRAINASFQQSLYFVREINLIGTARDQTTLKASQDGGILFAASGFVSTREGYVNRIKLENLHLTGESIDSSISSLRVDLFFQNISISELSVSRSLQNITVDEASLYLSNTEIKQVNDHPVFNVIDGHLGISDVVFDDIRSDESIIRIDNSSLQASWLEFNNSVARAAIETINPASGVQLYSSTASGNTFEYFEEGDGSLFLANSIFHDNTFNKAFADRDVILEHNLFRSNTAPTIAMQQSEYSSNIVNNIFDQDEALFTSRNSSSPGCLSQNNGNWLSVEILNTCNALSIDLGSIGTLNYGADHIVTNTELLIDKGVSAVQLPVNAVYPIRYDRYGKLRPIGLRPDPGPYEYDIGF